MSSYSELIAKAKAKQPGGGSAGPREFTVGGADNFDEETGLDLAPPARIDGARQDFSEIVSDATAGVDGEGETPGAPAGQDTPKPKPNAGDAVMTTKTFKQFVKAEGTTVFKDDAGAEHGIVFGWGIVCKEDGKDYVDLQNDHIPEDAMLDAAAEFAGGERVGKDMHAGDPVGQHIFVFPLTTDIAKALGITTKKTGLLLGYKPPADILAKYKSGEYTGFSIGGYVTDSEEVS